MSAPVDTSSALLEQGVPETIELLGLLIKDDMGLPDGVVGIYNQRRRLPPAKGFFIDVALLGSRPFAAKRGYYADPANDDLREVATANVQEIIQIDIFSYDESARLRKLELVFALNSTAAQQLADKWGFKASRVPANLVDVSENEGGARLNRFALTINVLRSYSRIKAAPTFTQFTNPPKTLLTEQ